MGTHFNDSAEIFKWNRENSTINEREFFTLNLQIVQTSYRKGYESENRFADVSISIPALASSTSGISINSSVYYPALGQGGLTPMTIEWDQCVIFNTTDKSLRFKIVKPSSQAVETLSQIIKGIYTVY